jgi:hypothetical protein
MTTVFLAVLLSTAGISFTLTLLRARHAPRPITPLIRHQAAWHARRFVGITFEPIYVPPPELLGEEARPRRAWRRLAILFACFVATAAALVVLILNSQSPQSSIPSVRAATQPAETQPATRRQSPATNRDALAVAGAEVELKIGQLLPTPSPSPEPQRPAVAPVSPPVPDQPVRSNPVIPPPIVKPTEPPKPAVAGDSAKPVQRPAEIPVESEKEKPGLMVLVVWPQDREDLRSALIDLRCLVLAVREKEEIGVVNLHTMTLEHSRANISKDGYSRRGRSLPASLLGVSAADSLTVLLPHDVATSLYTQAADAVTARQLDRDRAVVRTAVVRGTGGWELKVLSASPR